MNEVIMNGFCLLLCISLFHHFFVWAYFEKNSKINANILLKVQAKRFMLTPFPFYIVSAMVHNYITFSVLTWILEYVVCYSLNEWSLRFCFLSCIVKSLKPLWYKMLVFSSIHCLQLAAPSLRNQQCMQMLLSAEGMFTFKQ